MEIHMPLWGLWLLLSGAFALGLMVRCGGEVAGSLDERELGR